MRRNPSSDEFIELFFGEGGLLSRFLPSYECRLDQKAMALEAMRSYEREGIALIEAGTGTGKSLAYLVPAIYWAMTRGEVSVISTHTIALQEQLFFKDIPFLLKVLDVEIEVQLVKGMNNYLCLKKMGEAELESYQLTDREQQQFFQVKHWAQTTREGSQSEIDFPLHSSLWSRVSADHFTCTHSQCPSFKRCYFYKARKKLSEGKILIVNHYLLLSDIAYRIKNRQNEEKSILPKFSRIVIDEAHHLEDIALETFSTVIDRLELSRLLGKLYSEHHPEKSRCMVILKEFAEIGNDSSLLRAALSTDLPGEKRALLSMIEEFFKQLEGFAFLSTRGEAVVEGRQSKHLLRGEVLLSSPWQEQIKPSALACSSHMKKLSSAISLARKELILFIPKEKEELLAPHLGELDFISSTLEQRASQLESFISHETDINKIRWMEIYREPMSNVVLTVAQLNVSDLLYEHLFKPRKTAILCSATLTAHKGFAYFRNRMGMDEMAEDFPIAELIYPSPFDYKNRCLFLVPKDISFPTEISFTEQAAKKISSIIQISGGSCLILFTSYEMLLSCYSMVTKMEGMHQYPLLKQGDAARQVLIDTVKSKEGHVLFATDSFWEGIDIPGEYLRSVVIVKLPFKVPSDPLFQAISEVFEKKGLDPFKEYSLPLALLKFKQGFGRLIRTKEDRGCVVCLDKRIMTKPYGRSFIKSIPACSALYEDTDVMLKEMKNFFIKTGECQSVPEPIHRTNEATYQAEYLKDLG